MARVNKVELNGYVDKIKFSQNKETGEKKCSILLTVVHNKKRIFGNSNEYVYATIPVEVRNPNQLSYIVAKKIVEGDFLSIHGVLCSKTVEDVFICEECGNAEVYSKGIYYVYPIDFRMVDPKFPEVVEKVSLRKSDLEEPVTRDAVLKKINEKRKGKGILLCAKAVEPEPFAEITYEVISRSVIPKKLRNGELQEKAEISNVVHIMGNLCDDPKFNPKENEGGRVCTYTIALNRHFFIKEDPPSMITDFIHIKSLGEQAEKDFEALKKGALVYINGTLQFRSGYKNKRPCSKCGAENEVVNATGALEVVPYDVEYGRGANEFLEDMDVEDVIPPEFAQ